MSEHLTPDPLEALLASVLDSEPILEDPNLEAGLMSAFTTDVAEDIDPPAKIASRYGFRDGQHMIDFIAKNRGVRKVIKAKRAVCTSNANVETLNRKKANFIVGEVMATMAAPMFRESTPAAVRLDTFKAFSRMAGIDGVAAGAAATGGAAAGAGFTVNFLFSGQPTQTITTVVDTQVETHTQDLMPDLGPRPDYVPEPQTAKALPEPEPDPGPEDEPGSNRPGLAGMALQAFFSEGVGAPVGRR